MKQAESPPFLTFFIIKTSGDHTVPIVQHIPKVNVFVSWLVVTCVITPNWAGACQNTREQKKVSFFNGGGVRKYYCSSFEHYTVDNI